MSILKLQKMIGEIQSGSTALDTARRRIKNKTEIIQILEDYQNNKQETQKQLRNKLNLKGKTYKTKTKLFF